MSLEIDRLHRRVKQLEHELSELRKLFARIASESGIQMAYSGAPASEETKLDGTHALERS